MSDLRIGVGRLHHESNSFSCADTQASDFRSYQGMLVGNEVLNQPERRDEITGFQEVLCRERGIEIVPLFSTEALPSGLLSDDAVGYLDAMLRGQLVRAGRLDGICFALHGAISGHTIPDLDGHFLKVMREVVGPSIPIACPLDCHAVVTRQMVELATGLVAYRTHPHVDLVETGARAARILVDTLRGKVKPTTGHQRIPLLLPPPDAGTHAGALKELFDSFIAWDQMDGVIAGSLCPCYAWQDVPEQGWAALAVTNDDQGLADRLARKLAQAAWEARFRLLPEPMLSPQEAIRQAAAVDGCPVVITDSADTVGGGAGGDTTTLLSALVEMRHDVDGLILTHLPDPQAIRAVKAAQPGDTVTVEVGGKRDTRFGRPLRVTGQLLCRTEGPIHDGGHFGNEPMIDVGAIVCLGIDNVRLVLTERAIMGPQPSLYRKVDIDQFRAKIVALKTGVGFKTTYGHVAKAVIRADCPGSVSYNLHHFDFEHIPRPMSPLDSDFAWEPAQQRSNTGDK
jgi:microcystin degradation protein MlrC